MLKRYQLVDIFKNIPINTLKLNIFITLLLPYLVLILLLSLMGAGLYIHAINIAEEQIYQKNRFLLQEVQESMTLLIENADKLLAYFSTTASSLKFSDQSLNDKKQLAVDLFNMDLGRKLPDKSILHDFIQNYFILIESPPLIINNNFSISLTSYLKYYLNIDEDMRKHFYNIFFNQSYKNNPLVKIYSLMGNETRNRFSEIQQQLAMAGNFGGQYSGHNGVTIIYFDTESILKNLVKIDMNDDSGIFILNKENQIEYGLANGTIFQSILESSIITDSQIKQFKAESKWIITELEPIPIHPFRYISFQSQSYLRDQLKTLRYTLLSIILFLISGSIIFSLFVVFNNSRPISDILLNLKENRIIAEKYHLKLGFISRLFYVFSRKVQDISDQVREQSILLEKTVMEKILLGYHLNANILRNIVSKLLNPNATAYTVIIIKTIVDPLKNDAEVFADIALWKSQVKKLQNHGVLEEFYLYDQQLNEIILIHQKIQTYETRLEDNPLFVKIYDFCPYDIRIAIGDSVETIEAIHYSYEQAIWILNDDSHFTEKRIASYISNEKSEEDFYIPFDFERKMINSIIYEEKTKVDQLLNDFYIKNFVQTKISFALSQVLLNSLIRILMNVAQIVQINDENIKKSIHDLINQDLTISNYREYFFKILDISLEIVNYRNSDKKDNKEKIVNDLCVYIQKNFHNPLLSADHVGKQFNISGNYVFKLFKLYCNMSYHQYLESIRMKHSKKLLKHYPEKSIKSIALESGYYSLNTFYKVFKKYFNISAGKYRKLNNT